MGTGRRQRYGEQDRREYHARDQDVQSQWRAEPRWLLRVRR